jgi:hypothetical protein
MDNPLAIKWSPLQRAQNVVTNLEQRGLRIDQPHRSDLVALVLHEITQAEEEARRQERRKIAAEWLVESLPADVLQMAAERVTAQEW